MCRFPYPGQWGTIILTWSSVLTMFAGAISAMVESLGDYYAGRPFVQFETGS